MARPRVFISSTFYDLKHVRSSLDEFIEQIGYEPVRSEKGRIAYDPDLPLDESCYREAASADIFVLIIGGRYGSAASEQDLTDMPDFYQRYESITKQEYEAAVKRDIPTYILVDRSVYSEYETYRKNKGNNSVEYAHVDSINIFYLLEEILARSRNNPVQQFDNHNEIGEWLRVQWAGLFLEMIKRRSDQKQLSSLSGKVDELSSINASLQRYMEAVVSSVSKTPKEAKELIKAEQEKLDREKKERDFYKNGTVNVFVQLFDVEPAEILTIFTEVTTFDELRKRIQGAIQTRPSEYNNTYLNWPVDYEHSKDAANEIRSVLALPPLQE